MSLYYRNKQGRFARLPALMLTELVCWLLIFTVSCIALTVVIYRQVSILDERHSDSLPNSLKTSNEAASDGLAENKQGVTTSPDAPVCLLGKGQVTTHPIILSSGVEGHAGSSNANEPVRGSCVRTAPSKAVVSGTTHSRNQARPAQFNFSPGGDVFEQLKDSGN